VRHLLADRPEEQRPEPAEPSGADHEEIGLVGGGDEHRPGPALHEPPVDGNGGGQRPSLGERTVDLACRWRTTASSRGEDA
jgi:hypothetical protein